MPFQPFKKKKRCDILDYIKWNKMGASIKTNVLQFRINPQAACGHNFVSSKVNFGI